MSIFLELFNYVIMKTLFEIALFECHQLKLMNYCCLNELHSIVSVSNETIEGV